MAGGKEQGGSFGREAGGVGLEVAGAIVAGIGLLRWEAATILAGGVLFLIGSWLRTGNR